MAECKGGFRLKAELGGVRISTVEQEPHRFVTGMKKMSEPQHEGYHDFFIAYDQITAQVNHEKLLSIVSTAETLFRELWRKVKAGDRVLHTPTGEVWVLACDPEGGKVAWSGWPAGLAEETDCVLVESCSDEERKAMLTRVAGIGPDEKNALDWRTVVAKRQLEAIR